MAPDRPHSGLTHVRYLRDSTWLRTGDGRRLVLGGSPLRLFRLTEAGGRLVDRVEHGEPADRSTLVDRLLEAGAIHPLPPASDRWSLGDVTVVTPQLGGAAVDDGRITVDDGSMPPITGATTRLPMNRGPAAARNAGRRLVDTEFIAFVDADVHIDADVDIDAAVDTDRGVSDGNPSRARQLSWLEPLLAHFDDPRVGLVAPRVLGGPHTSLDLGDEPARIRVGTRVSYVPAAAIVVRAAAFDDVGGFDETLRFGEDVDFVWRLDAAGWSCRYEPASSVWHAPRPDRAGRWRQQVGYGSSAAPLVLRHPTALAPFRSDVLHASTWVIGALGHPVLGAACAIGSAASALRKLPGVPTAVALRLAATAEIATGRQLATAIRRVWWPLVVPLAVVSRRARRIALASVLADPSALPTDLAYGWGVWRGMRERRTLRPAVPWISTPLRRSGADEVSGSGPDRRS